MADTWSDEQRLLINYIRDNFVDKQPYARLLTGNEPETLAVFLAEYLFAHTGPNASESICGNINLLFSNKGVLTPSQLGWNAGGQAITVADKVTGDFAAFWNKEIAEGRLANLERLIEERRQAVEKGRQTEGQTK